MRNEKHFLVKQISDMIGNADYVYFISFAGLTVKDFSELRNQLAAQNAVCHVLKNTLIRKAGEALKIEGLETIDFTQGTALVAGKGDCSAAAKVLAEFGKKNDKVAAKGGYMDGAVLSSAEVGSLAELPSKPVLQAMLLGVREPDRAGVVQAGQDSGRASGRQRRRSGGGRRRSGRRRRCSGR